MGSYGVQESNYKNCWFLFVMSLLLTFIAVFSKRIWTDVMHNNVSTQSWFWIVTAVTILPSLLSIIYGILSIKDKEDVKVGVVLVFILFDIAFITIGRGYYVELVEYIFEYIGTNVFDFAQTNHAKGIGGGNNGIAGVYKGGNK